MSTAPYRIRRSSRARRARIEVDARGVELVLPRGMEVGEVESWVEGRRPWIERTLRRHREAAAAVGPVRLRDGGTVPYLGARLELAVAVEPGRRRAHVKRTGGVLAVKVGRTGPAAVREALERWYRARAREEIGARLDAATARVGRSYAGLSIRAQRTRWGSCSARGAMSFNWRLLLAPEAVLDYVIEHEVAHLDVPDHSDRFRDLLAARCPAYREHERWLRRHGSALVL